jgi:hypothetical protein
VATDPSADEIELAQQLYAEWDEGRGISKSQLEIRTWDDATSHGRHFDRFIRGTLGVTTNRPSSSRTASPSWSDRCAASGVTWNDPVARFRTGAFSLLFVTAWNSLAIATIQREGGE